MEVFFMRRYSATQINAELFWKFPKFLSINKKYVGLTNDDRMAYMLIKDRYRYSLSNNWIDKDKNVYVYFTIDDLKELAYRIQISKRILDVRLEQAVSPISPSKI